MKHQTTKQLRDLSGSGLLLRGWTLLAFIVIALLAVEVRAERLGDLADVVGARDNQLIGYGVVTGLNGTGDARTRVAEQTLRSMLRRLGVQVDEKHLRLRNAAAVIVTATIPPFARNGSKLDITVSSLGNARSLTGGVLIQTPLRGADRKVYAVAQGPLVVGGYGSSGRTGSAFQVNTSTTGRIVGGAIVEREIATTLVQEPKKAATDPKKKPAVDAKKKPAAGPKSGTEQAPEQSTLTYSLRTPDFVTAQRAAQAINEALGSELATAVDAGAVTIKLPEEFRKNPVPMLARLAEVEIAPHQVARVVINERTGTVVAGGDVRLAPVAIAQGGISVSIYEGWDMSQPNPFTFRGGTSIARPRSDLDSDEKKPEFKFIDGAATLSDVATALGALGVSPRELSSVLQALRTAGALRAEVVIQ
jgi:flagellar P-ring protein FlgI